MDLKRVPRSTGGGSGGGQGNTSKAWAAAVGPDFLSQSHPAPDVSKMQIRDLLGGTQSLAFHSVLENSSNLGQQSQLWAVSTTAGHSPAPPLALPLAVTSLRTQWLKGDSPRRMRRGKVK